MKKTLDIKLLEHFVAIYDYGSLLSAASHIGVGQPTLTKSLKKLEAHLGLQLFTRHTRELVPTNQAHEIYKKAQLALAEISDLETTASLLSEGEVGTVSIGCGAAIADTVVVPLIKTLRQQNIDINIKVITEDLEKLIHGLLTYQYDFILFDVRQLEELPEPERFQVTPLKKATMDVVLTQELLNTLNTDDPIPVLRTLKWAVPSQRVPLAFMDQFPKEYQPYLLPQGSAQYQIDSIYTCLDIAKSGLAGSIVPSNMVSAELEKGNLVKIDLPFEIAMELGAFRLRSRPASSAVEKVIQIMRSS